MGRIRWPWARGGTPETVYPLPGTSEVDDKVTPVVIGGVCDSRGILRSYLTFGEAIPLPSIDNNADTVLMPTTTIAGNASTICPTAVDMQHWYDLLITVLVTTGNCVAGEVLVELVDTALGNNAIGCWDAGEVAAGFRIDNPSTVVDGEQFVARFRACGGWAETGVQVTNGNAAGRDFEVRATRLYRIAGD